MWHFFPIVKKEIAGVKKIYKQSGLRFSLHRISRERKARTGNTYFFSSCTKKYAIRDCWERKARTENTCFFTSCTKKYVIRLCSGGFLKFWRPSFWTYPKHWWTTSEWCSFFVSKQLSVSSLYQFSTHASYCLDLNSPQP